MKTNGLFSKISAMAIVNSLMDTEKRLSWTLKQLKSDTFTMVKTDGVVYVLPAKSVILNTAKSLRDDYITSYTRNGNVRDRNSGKFVKTAVFEKKMGLFNQAIDLLMVR
jgi:hypothetical protein